MRQLNSPPAPRNKSAEGWRRRAVLLTPLPNRMGSLSSTDNEVSLKAMMNEPESRHIVVCLKLWEVRSGDEET